MTSPTRPLHEAVRDALADATRAMPYIERAPAGDSGTIQRIKQPAARSVVACLKTANLPRSFGKDGELKRVPAAALAASEVPMEAGIVASSRVASAGAQVIVCPEGTRAIAVGRSGGIAQERRPQYFRTVEAAAFATTVDDADAPLATLPIKSAEIDWSLSTVKSFRVELSRKDWHSQVDTDTLSQEIVTAVALGLARAADEVMLSKIAAALPSAFSLAAAASQGLKFAELRGLVGTAGNGASVAQDGALRVAGVASELTGDTASTFVGAWDRAAVAVHEDVRILFERTSLQGDLVVTVWADLIALLPDASKFWNVAA